MGKTELVEKVAQKTGLTKAESKKAIEALFSAVTESLLNGEEVSIVGFGSFKIGVRGARKGKNPRTGEVIEIPEKKVIRFRASKNLNVA